MHLIKMIGHHMVTIVPCSTASRLSPSSLPRAADLWVQASLEQRQRFQQLLFPDGISVDRNSFVRTAVTAPAFSYLRTIEDRNERLVDQTGIEPVTS